MFAWRNLYCVCLIVSGGWMLNAASAYGQLANQAQQQFKSRADDLQLQNNATKAQMQANANARRSALLSKTVTILREQNSKLRNEKAELNELLQAKQKQLQELKKALESLQTKADEMLSEDAGNVERLTDFMRWAGEFFESDIRPMLAAIKPLPAPKSELKPQKPAVTAPSSTEDKESGEPSASDQGKEKKRSVQAASSLAGSRFGL